MRRRWMGWILAAGLSSCAPAGPAVLGETPAADRGPIGSPFSDQRMGLDATLVLDRTDLRLGTTVHFNRIPTASELYDLTRYPSLAHVVLTLPAWPSDYAPLQSLTAIPGEGDLIVILRGYPPSRGAAEAWNLVGARLRIVVVVREPPPSSVVVADLNTMRGLERVIAEIDEPSRSGFERLQRPLSFRKVIE